MSRLPIKQIKPKCPLCHQRVLTASDLSCTDYISEESFPLSFCPVCKCAITKTGAFVKEEKYYGEAYYNAKSGKFTAIFEKIFHFNHKKNAKQLHRNYPASHILEVGCGRAYILKELKKLGCEEVVCLESASAAEWILNNKEVDVEVLKDETKWPFCKEHFDLIIYWHVFEHIPNPMESLKQATRCLAPGGILCISVPNISSLQARMHISTWFHLDVPRHLFHFSTTGLRNLLEKEGYQIVKIHAGDRMQNLFGWLQSVANLFTPWSINAFYRLLQGGYPLRSVSKLSLAIQLLTIPIWIPVGLAGFLIEEVSGKHGTITIYARKLK